jgi:uncharacterized protein (TIGR03435 family)
MRPFVRISFIALLSGAAFGQTAAAPPAFDIADVHVSPRSDWAKKAGNQMQAGLLNAGRYELRRATMLDLIKIAYAVDADKVYGGPSWLDYDRFEVIAKAPAATRPEALKLMLQSLLAERFKLAVKRDTKPVPAFVLAAGKDQSKLKPAAGSSSEGCQNLPPTFGDAPTGNIQCRGVTMEAFAAALRRFGSSFFDNLPVVNSTGLEGAWDIDLKYPLRIVYLSGTAPANAGTNGGIVEAVEKQLGLKLERGEAPQPVLVVESVNETPSANPPGVATALPPLPPLEFEVASIRPCDGRGPNLSPRFESGGRVTAHCMYLGNMIRQLWNLAPFEELVGAPKWLTDGSQPAFSVEAKAPAGNYVDAQGAQDRDALNAMMRALLVDRYKIQFHYEERPMDAQTLVAVKPKLTKADPSNRTGCTRQTPQTSGRGSPLRLVCQNITMTQFAEQLQGFDSQIFYPVLDGTGIEGAWDFTLNYDVLASLPPLPRRADAPAAGAAEAADPSGGVSFIEAVEKQLGLKLEKRKRPVNVLVIDHIEEKPTDN